MQFLEHDEEGRYDEEQCECAYRHTAYHAERKGTVAVGSCTSRYNQRYHAGNHGEHGHENGAQTLFASGKGGIAYRHALRTLFGCKLCDEDGGFGKQSDEHDDTCLQIDVVVHAG